MPFHGGEFQHTLSEAIAETTSGRYGEELTDANEEVAALINGTRDHYALLLRNMADTVPQDERAGFLRAADLLFPYTKNKDRHPKEFVRASITDDGAEVTY